MTKIKNKITSMIMLCCMIGVFSAKTQAQTNCNEVSFYAEAWSSDIQEPECTNSRDVAFYYNVEGDYNINGKKCYVIIKFEPIKNRIWVEDLICCDVEGTLRKNGADFYEKTWCNYQSSSGRFAKLCRVDNTKSNLKYTVYRFDRTNNESYFYAISKDRFELKKWTEDMYGNFTLLRTYTKVPKEDLLPKAANYDFLNE